MTRTRSTLALCRTAAPEAGLDSERDPNVSTEISALGSEALRTMVDVILPIARYRAQLIGRLRTAIEAGDDQRALALAREVAGL